MQQAKSFFGFFLMQKLIFVKIKTIKIDLRGVWQTHP